VENDSQKNVDLLAYKAISKDGKLIDSARTFDSDESLQKFYQSFGYVIIKNIIPINLIGEIQNDLTEIFSPFAKDKENPVDSAITWLDENDKSKLYEIHVAAMRAISFKSVSVHLGNLIKKLSGTNAPVLEMAAGFLLGIPKDKRLVFDFHQEANYMKGFEETFNIHYPLLRASTTDNGTMSILPSSQAYGTLTYEKKQASHDSYPDLVPTGIEKITSKLPELHCHLELGDCVIFHKDLIHKSNFNNSSLCRCVGVARFTQSFVGDWVMRKAEEL